MAGKTKQNIILQKRDIELIKTIHKCRFLTRNQIQNIFKFGSISCINTRLRKLCNTGYLEQRFLPIATATAQGLYSLGSKGEEVVAETLGIESDEITRQRRKNTKVGEFFLAHLNQVNDVRIAFSYCPDIKIIRWDYELPITSDKLNLRPDAFFQLIHQKKLYSFFLEVDRNTESPNKFVDTKLNAYLKIIQDGVQKSCFGINYFAVLTVINTPKRLNTLFNAISKKVKGVFWFIEWEKLTPESITTSIFIKAGETQRKCIIGGVQ